MILAAAVEVLLAAGEVDAARAGRRGARRRRRLGRHRSQLRAVADYAAGIVLLADGDAAAALVALRRASEQWRELEMPYDAARARVQVADRLPRARRRRRGRPRAGGRQGHVRAARRRPDLARVAQLTPPTASASGPRSLSPRECEVLRLVATGRTNREIASGAGDQRAHRRPPPAEHLRQARPAVPRRGDRLRLRARTDHRRCASSVVRTNHASRASTVVNPGDPATAPLAPYRSRHADSTVGPPSLTSAPSSG